MDEYDDDPYDLSADAADEAAFDAMYERIRDEFGSEIAEDLDRNELLDDVAWGHSEWWARCEAAICKADERLSEGQWEEAVFHAARSFDAYLKNVLCDPVRAQVVARFERAMPPFIKVKDDLVLKSVTGAGTAAIFAMYSASEILNGVASREAILDALNDFLKADGTKSNWHYRDRVIHAPIQADQTLARRLVETVRAFLEHFYGPIEGRLCDLREQEHERKFNPSRVEALRKLVEAYDANPDEWVEVSDGMLTRPLFELRAHNFVELREKQNVFSPMQWRATQEGEQYWHQEIEPHL